LLVVRSDSLLPAVVFHVIFNGLQVVRTRVDQSVLTREPLEWFFRFEGGEVRYRWPTLLICGVISLVLLRWLVRWRPHGAAGRTGAVDAGGHSAEIPVEPAFANERTAATRS
jgi:hypothetical protein